MSVSNHFCLRTLKSCHYATILSHVRRFKLCPPCATLAFKRLSGLDVLMTFIVAFCLGVCVLAASYVVSHQLQVDLWALGEGSLVFAKLPWRSAPNCLAGVP